MRGAVEGLRGTGSPPWEPPHTPMKARFADFEERLRADKDTKAVTRAEQNGQAALDALQGFQNNEGAGIMSRIREAARNNPGGMEGVLSEMRPAAASPICEPSSTVRSTTTAASRPPMIKPPTRSLSMAIAAPPSMRSSPSRRQPALGARFEALDAQIGEAAGKTPSSRGRHEQIGRHHQAAR